MQLLAWSWLCGCHCYAWLDDRQQDSSFSKCSYVRYMKRAIGGNQRLKKTVSTGPSIHVTAESAYPARLLLEFGCLLGVGHCPLYKAHWLVHVALNSVNHATLDEGGTRQNTKRGENIERQTDNTWYTYVCDIDLKYFCNKEELQLLCFVF